MKTIYLSSKSEQLEISLPQQPSRPSLQNALRFGLEQKKLDAKMKWVWKELISSTTSAD